MTKVDEQGVIHRDKEKVWLWYAGLFITIVAQIAGAIWFFAQLDARLVATDLKVEILKAHVEKIDEEAIGKTHDNVLILQKDHQHQNYRLKIVEDWMKKWVDRAEDTSYHRNETNTKGQ